MRIPLGGNARAANLKRQPLLNQQLLDSGFPLAADRRDDSALLLQLCESLIHDFTVETGDLRDFACVQRFARLPHGVKDQFFFIYDMSLSQPSCLIR